MQVFATITVLLLTSISCGITSDTNTEEQEIRDLWNRFINSICDGNWEVFSKAWDHSPKVSVIHPHIGEKLNGWEEIQPKYHNLLNSAFRCSLPKNELEIHISNSGDMAWGIVDLIVQLNDSAKTTNHPWQSVVFEKIQGEWKLVHLFSTLPKLE